MEHRSKRRRPSAVDSVRSLDDVDIAEGHISVDGADGESEVPPMGGWSGEVQVEKVLVARVVNGAEEAEHPGRIPDRPRDEVRQSWGRAERAGRADDRRGPDGGEGIESSEEEEEGEDGGAE